MSLFITVEATCGKCGTVAKVDFASSVNADRRPDLRQAILDETFQATVCASCGTTIRLPAHITYLDIGRHQWILVEDAARLADWHAVEAEAVDLFKEAFGPQAPSLQQEIGASLTARLVFGWPALREKLIAQEEGMDDVVLELLKVGVVRNVPSSPLSDGTELRLVQADQTNLILRWINSSTEQGLSDLTLDRSLYEDLAANQEPWEDLKADLTAGLFVDMNRILRE